MSEMYMPYAALLNYSEEISLKEILVKEVKAGTPTKGFRAAEFEFLDDLLEHLKKGNTKVDGVVRRLTHRNNVFLDGDWLCNEVKKMLWKGIQRFVFVCDCDGWGDDFCQVNGEIRNLLAGLGLGEDYYAVVNCPAASGGEGSAAELMEAINRVILNPVQEAGDGGAFRMPVEQVFKLKDGVVAAGTVMSGTLKAGEKVEIVGFGKRLQATVGGLELFRKLLDWVEMGDAPGVFLKGITADELEPGMMLTTPGSTQMTDQVKAYVYVLTPDEHGSMDRSNMPLMDKCRPEFCINGVSMTSYVRLSDGDEVIMPGLDGIAEIALIHEIPYVKGQQFQLLINGMSAKGVVKGVVL